MTTPSTSPRPVIYVHDAAIDEYMATVLLTTMAGVSLQGVVIVNADCIAGPAMQAAWKLNAFLGTPSLPLALSDAKAVNAFPWSYRADCLIQNAVAALSSYPENQAWPWTTPPSGTAPPPTGCGVGPHSRFPSGETLLTQLLADAVEQEQPVDLLVTSPMTPVRTVLEAQPELQRGIARIVWMGGALDGMTSGFSPVPSQVVSPYAEWNAWWDAGSVDWVFRHTTFPIDIVPLNVTRAVPLSPAFMASLASQGAQYRYSALASQSYGAIVDNEPYYDMWDTLAAAYLTRPDLFSAPSRRSLVMCARGNSEGVLIETPGGREVNALLTLADAAGFYDYFLTQFRA